MKIKKEVLDIIGFSKEQIDELKKNDGQISITIEEEELESDNIEISQISDNDTYPAEVRIEKMQYSISHIYNLLFKRKELILSPEFQRNNVWKPKQKSELVESILMGIPIPIIYLFENQMGEKQVVDGKQRITALTEFLEGSFKLKDLTILTELNGKDIGQLTLKQQGVFEDYQLFFYVIQPPTPERIKYDIFDRVNRGGTSINKQEMRNALYGGKCVELLKTICQSTEFINATGGALKPDRMKDQYTALRVLAFLMLKTGAFDNINEDLKYRGDIDDFLARFMIFINKTASDDFIDKYYKLLLASLNNSYMVLGKDGFRFIGGEVRRPINMPLMEALVYFFSKGDSIMTVDTDNIWMAVEALKETFDGSKYFSGNVDSTTSIDYRFGEVDKILN